MAISVRIITYTISNKLYHSIFPCITVMTLNFCRLFSLLFCITTLLRLTYTYSLAICYIDVPSLCFNVKPVVKRLTIYIQSIYKIIKYTIASQINTMFSTCIPVLFVGELILIIYALGTIGSRS